MSTTKLLTDGEAAELLRMLPKRLIRLAKAGRVPAILLPDGEYRFDEADLLRWIDEFRQPAREAKQ